MAIIPQIHGQTNLQPIPAVTGSFSKPTIFGEPFSNGQTSLDPAKVFTNYFKRVFQKYKDMNTTNIENLVKRVLQEQDHAFLDLVRKETYLRDTFINRFSKAKTPLGEVLQELNNIQERPGRALLSKEIFRQAEKEAGKLIKKKVALATEKGGRKQISNELSISKRQTITFAKFGPELYINTYVTSDQANPSTLSLGNGTFVVTWNSSDQDGSLAGVFGQIFNADGTKNGAEFQINTYVANHQAWPVTASLSNGQFVVTWQSDGQDGSSYGAYGQILNADGTKSGSEFQINTYTLNDQESLSVSSLSNGKFVVTWMSGGQDGSTWGVYGQICNADGTKSGSEFKANTYVTNEQGWPSIASLSNGRFVVTWSSNYQDGSGYGVYGQLFNADGTQSGWEFQINTYTANSQSDSSVASLSNDQFVVVWNSEDQDGSVYGIFGQMFNADGTKSGSEFQVNTYTLGNQLDPSIASFGDDKFIVTWDSWGQDGSSNGVYAQLFNADGTKNGFEFQVNTYTTRSQRDSSVAALSNTSFIVSWESDRQDGFGWGVFGQIFKEVIPTSSTTTTSTSSTTASSTSSTTASSTSSTASSTSSTESSTSSSISSTSSTASSTSFTPTSSTSSIRSDVISGAKSQVSSIALTVLGWMIQTVKGVFGYE